MGQRDTEPSETTERVAPRRERPRGEGVPARWSALLDGVAAAHPARGRSADWLCVELALGDIAQTVQLKCVAVDGQALLLVTADVCGAEQLCAADALEVAASLPFGAIVLRRGILSVRHIFGAERVVEDELHAAIGALAHNAVGVRAVLQERLARRMNNHFHDLID